MCVNLKNRVGNEVVSGVATKGREIVRVKIIRGCSQCGCDFIVGIATKNDVATAGRAGGFSHCQDHAGLVEVEW